MYMDVNLGDGKKMTIVLPVTSGSKGNLSVGKRGVFYDHAGRDYDATIVQLQENPVCIQEALLAPFSKFWGIIEGKIMQWQAKAEAAATAGFTNVVEGKGAANAAAVPGAPAKPDEKKDGGLGGGAMLGMGVAFAALGSAIAFISKTVAGMTGFQIWMMVFILILALLLPLSIIAIIQLNRQDLSSVLEGCGWGINLRLRLDTKLRSQFTYTGKYPANAEGTPKSYWLKVLIFILLLVICISGGCKYYAVQKAKAEAAKAEAVKREEAQKAAEAAKAEDVKKAAETAKQDAEKKAAEAAPASAPAPAAKP
ncbi:MAG: hypothetical protein IJJ33_10505 [Victivallales bacterium]|nr:hypothetical protein [Victivallales bacterium]